MINFKQYLYEWKHVTNYSLGCEHCNKALKVVDIIKGKWMYPIGQLYSCECNKSKIFTNTIRNVEKLLSYLNNETPNYSNGFCNDKRCGHCFGGISSFYTGVDVPENMEINKGTTYARADRYGCSKCKDNQNILQVGGDSLLPENDKTVRHFINFYNQNKNKIEDLANQLR